MFQLDKEAAETQNQPDDEGWVTGWEKWAQPSCTQTRCCRDTRKKEEQKEGAFKFAYNYIAILVNMNLISRASERVGYSSLKLSLFCSKKC